MGQAKRRGTYEERKARAILLKQSQADQRLALDPAIQRHMSQLDTRCLAALMALATAFTDGRR